MSLPFFHSIFLCDVVGCGKVSYHYSMHFFSNLDFQYKEVNLFFSSKLYNNPDCNQTSHFFSHDEDSNYYLKNWHLEQYSRCIMIMYAIKNVIPTMTFKPTTSKESPTNDPNALLTLQTSFSKYN
jgi:hypothetical protein